MLDENVKTGERNRYYLYHRQCHKLGIEDYCSNLFPRLDCHVDPIQCLKGTVIPERKTVGPLADH